MSIDDATPEEWDALNRKLRTNNWLHRAKTHRVEGKTMDILEDINKTYSYNHNGYAKKEPKVDVVNNPSHYNTGNIECIEAIEESMSTAEFKGYLKGNTMKYLWRYDYKEKPVEDLKKARWYLDRLIKSLEEASNG